jgi:hypothetical protein
MPPSPPNPQEQDRLQHTVEHPVWREFTKHVSGRLWLTRRLQLTGGVLEGLWDWPLIIDQIKEDDV